MSGLLRLPRRARLLVLGTIGSGAATLAWQLQDLGGWSQEDLFAFAGLALAVALSEQGWIPLKHRTETENFSLTDAVFAAGLILVRPSAFLLGVAVGAFAGQALRRTAPLKLGFNVGQFTLGLALAALLYGAFRPSHVGEEAWWLVAAGAMAAYAIVNFVAVGVVIALAERESVRSALLPGLDLSLLHWAGNVQLGLLGALVITFDPDALPLLVGPIALAYIAYRGWLRATHERDRLSELAEAADAIVGGGDLRRRVPEAHASEDTARLASTLNRMLERLERAFQRERRFIREASHELRTPITISRGHLEVLGPSPSPEAVHDAIEVTLDELRRMGRIVDDLSTLARAENPGFVRRGTVELRLFVEDLAVKARPLLNGRFRPELPPASAVVEGDEQRLMQAMLNLVANAARYTPDGSPVSARVVPEAQMWRFEVADEGGGLDPGLEEAVFAPFIRGANGRSGSGLGLAIARGVAEAHGGEAGVDNRPGEGTTFWLRIPR